ncbi:GH19990 [Drosophila grimshawi]|uniref:GH19990 n=2 Tax=Drosophila grimshawi TaxID=7222 RepID=B4J840_DROGR|nr:GH19990 [Drosophila grimshawi]
MANKTSSGVLQFKIKLLSGNNVVLVDCVGYDSQLFVPQIIKGVITFQNIIPSNRCCNAACGQGQKGQFILPATKFGNVRIVPPLGYNSGVDVSNKSAPLARSTPSRGSSVRAEKENVSMVLTPEQTRCRPTQMMTSPTSATINSDTQPFLESSFHTCNLPISELPDVSPLRPVANTPDSSLRRRLASTASSPDSATTSEPALYNFMHKAPPLRTYSRRKGDTTTQSTASISWSPLSKKKRLAKVSSTKPPSPRLKMEVRHRKLIVDQKKTLSQPDAPTLSIPIIKTKIQGKLVSAKTRRQFEALKLTAFDLLTSPGISRLSSELYQQFKDACVDRYCETLPSYVELSSVAPLQQDRQVKTLLAKKKRLERQLTKSEQARLIKGRRV